LASSSVSDARGCQGSRSRSRSPQEVSSQVQETDSKESLNVPLQDQLRVLNMIFPQEVKLKVPEENPRRRIEKPEMIEPEPEVQHLPFHKMIRQRLANLHLEMVRQSKSQAGIRTEMESLASNAFPKSFKLNDRFAPEDLPSFLSGYSLDANLYKIIQEQKIRPTENQRALDVLKVSRLTADACKALSATSWAMWFNETNNIILKHLHEDLSNKAVSMDKTMDQVQMLWNLSATALQSTKHVMEQLLQILCVGTLAQRDAYLLNVDRDLPKEIRLKLRNAPFDGPTLFNGQVDSAAKDLQEVSQRKAATRPINVRIDYGKSGSDFARREDRREDRSGRRTDTFKPRGRGSFQAFQSSFNSSQSYRGKKFSPSSSSATKFAAFNYNAGQSSFRDKSARGRGSDRRGRRQ